jgi:ribosomal protein L11 methyltransferase
LIRLAVRCRPKLAERVLAELVELAPGGVEEDEGDGYVELAIYGQPGELPELPELEAAAGDGLVEITSTEIPDDWSDRWRDFHEPVAIANGRLVVRPSWRQAQGAGGPAPPGHATSQGPRRIRGAGTRVEEAPDIDVVIDPGQAFGTGAHATTAVCLEILLGLADAGEARGSFADLGTGSGVLAIAAAKLGWGPVVGVDSEPKALEAAAANAEANGVELDLLRMNLRQDTPPVAATMVANLTAPLLVEVAARLASRPWTLICSGLLVGESNRVTEALGAAGLAVVERYASGDWAALRLERDSAAASV